VHKITEVIVIISMTLAFFAKKLSQGCPVESQVALKRYRSASGEIIIQG